MGAKQATHAVGAGKRRRRGPRPLPPPEPWEQRVLRLISEQQAIPFDQLARFLECEEEQAARVVKHLTKAKYADYGRFLYEEPHWVWLTHRGAYLSGTSFKGERPKVGAMARMRAVNEIRLHIARRAPEARWVSRRALVRDLGTGGRLPNAMVKVHSERHAICVMLNQHDGNIVRSRIETHMARYDAVVAFANRGPRKQLERLQAEHHWPKLVIRDIPKSR